MLNSICLPHPPFYTLFSKRLTWISYVNGFHFCRACRTENWELWQKIRKKYENNVGKLVAMKSFLKRFFKLAVFLNKSCISSRQSFKYDYVLTSSLNYSSFLSPLRLKCLPGIQETWVWSLGQEDPLEKKMATHSSTLAWRIPWREKPGRLQSGGRRVGQDWVVEHVHTGMC